MKFLNKNFAVWFSRFAIFVVYAWFGILKVVDASPANPLVKALLEKTLHGVSFDTFIIWFGLFEVLIGALFLFPKLTRFALGLLVIHLGMVLAPLVLLPQIAWQSFMIPTLEGQYMIKNILIVAAALHIFTNE